MTAPMLNTFQQVDHAILPKSTHDERSRQEFTKSFKQFIQQGLLPGLDPIYRHRAASDFKRAEGRDPRDRWDIRTAMIK
ncbi:MAG: class I SAM-dependent methyltransferase, partial [Pseudomonadota bacterium]